LYATAFLSHRSKLKGEKENALSFSLTFNFHFINFCQIAVLQSSCDFTDITVGHVARFSHGRSAASPTAVLTILLLPQSSTLLVLAMAKFCKQQTKELARTEICSHSLNSGRVNLHQPLE